MDVGDGELPVEVVAQPVKEVEESHRVDAAGNGHEKMGSPGKKSPALLETEETDLQIVEGVFG